MNITALIVDDEQISRDVLHELLRRFCPGVIVVGATGKPEEAIHLVRSAKPDILFLDINLGAHTGFDLLDMLHRYDCNVIFTTGHGNFALKAFEYAAAGYLMKPVDHKKLIECVHRIRQKKEVAYDEGSGHVVHASQHNILLTTTIALSDMNKTDFVPLQKIVYLKSNGPYTTFYLDDAGQYTQSKTLKFYEDALRDHSQFLRVHKSYLVNKLHIKAYRKATSALECSAGITVPTTLAYKTLLDLLKQ